MEGEGRQAGIVAPRGADAQGPGMTCPGRFFSSKIAGGFAPTDVAVSTEYSIGSRSRGTRRTWFLRPAMYPFGGPLWHRLWGLLGGRCPNLADHVRGPASRQICVPKFGRVCDASWGCPPSVRELPPTHPNVAQGAGRHCKDLTGLV